ncbi:hypothetical protein CTA1_2317 [Colletotrichum tanaceti]|uniref:Uncharacterized protein n=1 Tax=Colletotrichum tanaceti TaxID=1306861 RepID=A0A4U6X3H6_9PEZI|nr:hypothetical protein CTA1_2317 [Colletotrichum tanaceti]
MVQTPFAPKIFTLAKHSDLPRKPLRQSVARLVYLSTYLAQPRLIIWSGAPTVEAIPAAVEILPQNHPNHTNERYLAQAGAHQAPGKHRGQRGNETNNKEATEKGRGAIGEGLAGKLATVPDKH